MPSVRATTIGILTAEVGNAYSLPILREVDEVAREHNVGLLYFVERVGPEDVTGTRLLTSDLASIESVDALLVLPLSHALSARELALYCERFQPLPICSIQDIAGSFASRVSVDNEPGLRVGINHLIEVHGLRSIAFVRGPESSGEAELRYRIYRDVLDAHEIQFDEALVMQGEYVVQSGIDAVRTLLDRRGRRPQAFVCANDGMALGVLRELSARGILVPDEIALLGFDDIELARYLDPPLTTVRQPLTELGRAAMTLLLEQLATGQPCQHLVLPTTLVVRESCGCVAYRPLSGVPSSAPAARTPVGLEALLKRSPQVISSLSALSIAGAPTGGWQESLYRAFVADISGGNRAFLGELRHVLEAISAARGDVGSLHRVITILGQFARKDLLPGAPEWRRGDALLHAARVKISGVAERAPAAQQVRLVDASYKLTRASSALSSVVDYQAMSWALFEHLPGLGISSCHVCVYESVARPATWSSLVAGFDTSGPLEIPLGRTQFESQHLWPSGALDTTLPARRLVVPLTRADASPGFAVFAHESAEDFVYENLLVHIGAAVARLRLLAELVAEVERRQHAERERVERELAIAKRIQTGILPKRLTVPGLEIAGVMLPASEVGGDYYDIIPVEEGCWIGIGDVAGHGLAAGLVMFMLQSVVSGLVHAAPRALPSQIVPTVNQVLFENIRERMDQDEFVTFSLLRYDGDGSLVYAGAHEDLLVHRAQSGRAEWLTTGGTWLGAIRDIRSVTTDARSRLEIGDVLVAYTDGVIEAQNTAGELYLPERLAASLERVASEPVDAICAALLSDVQAWMNHQNDDLTLVVIRRVS